MNSRPILGYLVLGALAAVPGTLSAQPENAPGLVCMKHSTFEIRADERIAGGAGDVEDMRLVIEGPHGSYSIAEGEVWAPTDKEKQSVYSRGTTTVYRVVDDAPVYAIYGPDPIGGERLYIWLRGEAFDGTSRDRAIYSRFVIGDPDLDDCDDQYTYSSASTWKLRLEKE